MNYEDMDVRILLQWVFQNRLDFLELEDLHKDSQ